jgi:flagellar motor switch protein FliN
MSPKLNVQAASLQDLGEQASANGSYLLGIEDAGQLMVSIAMEVGQRRITIRELLQLNVGSVVQLDTSTGDPFDVLVNGVCLASGEPVVINDKLGIRVCTLSRGGDRLHRNKPE